VVQFSASVNLLSRGSTCLIRRDNAGTKAARRLWEDSVIAAKPKIVQRSAVFVVSLLMSGCLGLGPQPPREPVYAMKDTSASRLGVALSPQLARHPGQSAFYPLGSGVDALVARLAFIDIAEVSVDVQYYLFHDDDSGRLLIHHLLKAADRGVRVRILLDDMDMNGRDEGLAGLALHPNIDIRLFNPFPSRSLRYLNFLTHFGTVTRRMHNKSLVVDNQTAVVGGRNIGDEYFEASEGVNFGDMDVLAAGLIVDEVSDAFDAYWNSDLAWSLSSLGAKGDPELLIEARRLLQVLADDLADSTYGLRLQQSRLTAQLSAGELPWYWASAHLLYDLPEKVVSDPEDRATHMGPELGGLLAAAQREVIAISPYFVPGEKGTALLEMLVARGVSVTIVTNSLAATDVPAVHSGYVRYRKRLLASGVEIFEMPPSSIAPAENTTGAQKKPRLGASQASLHAKTFAIDGERIIVGSMNMDPRSSELNTELGVVIESAELAEAIKQWRETQLPEQAWRVELTSASAGTKSSRPRLQWVEQTAGETVVRTGPEPEASWWRRFVASFVAWLPIEQQL
jgi:putative cardiolipin synthase